MSQRPEVIFVGGFDDRFVKGGQVFACKSLVASPISKQVKWVLIDSSMASSPPPPFWCRAIAAIGRIFSFVRALSTRPNLVILFASSGASFAEKTLMAILARLVGTPVAFCPRSGLVVGMADKSITGRLLIKTAIRVSSLLICQGEHWANFYRSIEPTARTSVIHNFINPKPYLSIESNPQSQLPVILFLGSVEINKGIYDLVGAAEVLVKEGRKFHIYIGGHGGEMENLRSRIIRGPARDAITLLGLVEQPEKIELLGRASVVVLPSYQEGFPNVILEAMASARPVVATLVGAIPELVKDGVSGFLIKPGDQAGLARALARLMDFPASARLMGSEGRNHVLKKHSADKQWMRWRDELSTLLNKHE